MGPSGYGLLLGALGIGAVAGSFALPWLRARLSPNLLLATASVAYAAVLVGVVLIPNTYAAVVMLLPTGLAWIAVLSTMNASLQLFLPHWVRARGLSVYALPQLAFDAAAEHGPVVVKITYTIAPDRVGAFLDAMVRVRLSRLRTGATQWGVFRDGETLKEFVELFVVATWDEHLRQHNDRLTGVDEEYLDTARALSDPLPRTSHLIATDRID